MYPHLPTSMTQTRSRAHLTSYLPTVYNPHKSLSISCTTWRWPLSSAETCSCCTLCSKYYIRPLPSNKVVRQVHTLHPIIINRLKYTSVHREQAPPIHCKYTLPQTNRFTIPFRTIRCAISKSDTFIYGLLNDDIISLDSRLANGTEYNEWERMWKEAKVA